jgi:hypothetical protein
MKSTSMTVISYVYLGVLSINMHNFCCGNIGASKVDDPECESETRLVALVCMYLSLALGEKVLPRRDAQKTQHTDQISFCNSIGEDLKQEARIQAVCLCRHSRNPRAPNKFSFRTHTHTQHRSPISIK